jgi:hypothetical protein
MTASPTSPTSVSDLPRGSRRKHPRMPNEDDPCFATWRPTLQNEIASLDDGAILDNDLREIAAVIESSRARPPSR